MLQEQTKEPVIIQIERNAIENCNCDTVIEILDSFMPELCEQNRNNVMFEVTGYGDDNRNVWDVPEIRQYFRKLFDTYKGLFYWIDLDSPMFILLALLLYTPVKNTDGITVSPKDLQQYLMSGFTHLNEFCAENNLSAEPSTQAIRRYLGMDEYV